MKQPVEKRKPSGTLDYIALAVTTFGVGYIPGAPGTYGSIIAILLYIAVEFLLTFGGFLDPKWMPPAAIHKAQIIVTVCLFLFTAIGVWAANRSVELLGNTDANEAVVDEVIGQLVTFLFVPFELAWWVIATGFILFRVFDIWKPYPIDQLQRLPGGLGIVSDDILAGVYAGVCLSIIYAVSLTV